MTLFIFGMCWLAIGVVGGFALCMMANNNNDDDGGAS